MIRLLRQLLCRLGLHNDGTDVFGGYSPTCLRCGYPTSSPPPEDYAVTEAQAHALEGDYVRLELADGTVQHGFLFGVGYQGITLMTRGVKDFRRFSEIRTLARGVPQ